jgi:hypothetical protein
MSREQHLLWSPGCTPGLCEMTYDTKCRGSLVPEIAAIYAQEPQIFEEYAKQHTARYARADIYPNIDADGVVTWEERPQNVEELARNLVSRIVDDLAGLKDKYERQRSEQRS